MINPLTRRGEPNDPRVQEIVISMSELDTTTPGMSAVMDREAKRDAAKDASKSQLRVLAKGDNRWDDEEYTDEEEAAMIEMYQGTLASIDEGEIVKSKVLEIRDNMVILDIGFKSEGAVPLEEFKDFPDLKAGDEVEVLLEHLEDAEGSVVLSKKKADFMRVWERIRQAYENDLPVEGTLVKKIKGGVVVDLMGVDAFL
ncbi:MAG: S1 RNA-binding domain-containing protein, partial [Gemmatimonadaceae bacterium]